MSRYEAGQLWIHTTGRYGWFLLKRQHDDEHDDDQLSWYAMWVGRNQEASSTQAGSTYLMRFRDSERNFRLVPS